MLIRVYEDRDKQPVRELFLRVNRSMAPADLRAEFEAYILRSLDEEIDRIPAYYAERAGGFWVAEDADTLVGMYGLERISQDVIELRRMYVAPEMRRRGIARALLEHAELQCRWIGAATLTLSTSEVQQAALGLYRNAGFHLVGEERSPAMTHKALGGGLRRFHFQKSLTPVRHSEPSE